MSTLSGCKGFLGEQCALRAHNLNGTLLRLLLPLNYEIRIGSEESNGNLSATEKPPHPEFSSSNSIGRSDGRCVQR